MEWIYLDNNATTQPAPQVVEAVNEMLQTLWANPSSVHRFGQMVRQRVELARASVAALLGAKPREILFTSGGTESNNLALHGVLGPVYAPRARPTEHRDDASPPPAAGPAPSPVNAVLITTTIEHSAVREPAQELEARGVIVDHIAPQPGGWIDPATVAAAVDRHIQDGRVILLSIQWANNETGVIQPIQRIAQEVRQARASAQQAGQRVKILLHVDAVQVVGKIPVDVKAAGVDLLSLSGHKFHGPKGIGALYVRSGVRLRPLVLGGSQEREQRAGTENTPGIAGLGVAAELAQAFLADSQRIAELAALRDRFESAILQAVPGAVVNSVQAESAGGDGPARLWNTSNLGFPGLEAEAILLGLSERGVCASAGAACSSGSLEPSPVLRAMGVPEAVAHGSVRFSISRDTTPQQVEEAARLVPQVVARLGRTMAAVR